MASFVREVVPLFAKGLLRPVIAEVIPLRRGNDAYTLLSSNETFGKVVLDAHDLAASSKSSGKVVRAGGPG